MCPPFPKCQMLSVVEISLNAQNKTEFLTDLTYQGAVHRGEKERRKLYFSLRFLLKL